MPLEKASRTPSSFYLTAVLDLASMFQYGLLGGLLGGLFAHEGARFSPGQFHLHLKPLLFFILSLLISALIGLTFGILELSIDDLPESIEGGIIMVVGCWILLTLWSRLPRRTPVAPPVTKRTRRGLDNLISPQQRQYILLSGAILGLGIGLSSGLSVGLSLGLSLGLGAGLSAGLSYWLLLGLYQGILQEQVEDQDRWMVNQGVHRSFRMSAIMGTISAGVIGIMGVLNFWLFHGLITGLFNGLITGLSIGLSIGLSFGLSIGQSLGLSNVLFVGVTGGALVFALTGGLAVFRHYSIRLLLWESHDFPWQAALFLEDAATRNLLRRVGGGYSFSHRLLLDYFADLDPTASPEATHGLPTKSSQL